MNEKYTEFSEQAILGAQVCIKLKQIYWPDQGWFESYRHIAAKLTGLKRKARTLLKHMDEAQMLKTLRGFSDADLKEICDDE